MIENNAQIFKSTDIIAEGAILFLHFFRSLDDHDQIGLRIETCQSIFSLYMVWKELHYCRIVRDLKKKGRTILEDKNYVPTYE